MSAEQHWGRGPEFFKNSPGESTHQPDLTVKLAQLRADRGPGDLQQSLPTQILQEEGAGRRSPGQGTLLWG